VSILEETRRIFETWIGRGHLGDRLHLASGDIQSAGIAGMRVVTESHEAFEFSSDARRKP